MSPKDKLAVGMSLFVIFVAFAAIAFPAQAYHDYFADLRRRKRGVIANVLLALVFALSLPYFYDELVGFDSQRLSMLLQFGMSLCVYLLLFDVARYVYKNFRPPSRPRRQIRK